MGIYTLLPPRAALSEVIDAHNRLVKRDAGLAAAEASKIRWTLYDGVDKDPYSGATSSSNNYTQVIRNTAGKHRATLLSGTSATATPSASNAVEIVDDAFFAVGAGKELRVYDSTGAGYANLTGDVNGLATLGGSGSSAGAISLAGGITVTGLAKFFQADWSNATVANRFAFQTSTANSATGIIVTPNGSGTTGAIALFNSSNVAAGSFLNVGATSADVRVQTTNIGATTLPLRLYVDGNVRIACDTTGIGFFNIGPVARASAITQTYATTTRTHNNPASSTLTGITSSSTGTALTEPDVGYVQATWQLNMRRLQDQYNALRNDVLELKQLYNALVDDMQAYGLEQ